jgi:tetratricopeptide (TPR) repeat protein
MISPEDFKDAEDFFRSDQKEKFLNGEISELTDLQVFHHAKSALIVFMQENISGPPLGLSRWTGEGLELEGEDCVSWLLGGEFLLACSRVFLNGFERIEHLTGSYLWRGRYCFIHQQALNHPVESLYLIILESYPKAEESALVHVEFSRCLIYYSKYESCERELAFAESCTGIKYGLTGKMGVRTKFQKQKTPQLVLSVISQEKEETEPVKVPSSVTLDEDCPLHENPQIEEEEKEALSLEDSILLLAWVNFYFKSRPPEDLNTEIIGSYIEKILSKSLDWLVFSTGLLYRSKNQFSSFKFRERSVIQLNTLVEQYSDPEPLFRLKYVFSLGYPLRHWLKVELAEMFLKLGAVHSAFQEFETVKMWEEAVECLIMGSMPNKAIDLARSQLEIKKTPRMLCALADATGDLSLYEEAWEVSRQKCSRAQRSLGRLKFEKGLNNESIEHFKKALEINPLYPTTWFTLGCVYMKTQEFQSAASAFQRLICIDNNLAEAWNNLAACHSRLGNALEAYNALVQGIKHDRQNWKMTENLLILSLQVQKFFTAVECIQHLLLQGQTRLFDKDLFRALNVLSSGKEQKMLEVYQDVVNKITVECGVWKFYADFVEKNFYEPLKVLEIRTKACRSAMTRENNQKNAYELEEIAQDLNRAYQAIEDPKVRYEGKLYLASVCKKIKETLGRDAILE